MTLHPRDEPFGGTIQHGVLLQRRAVTARRDSGLRIMRGDPVRPHGRRGRRADVCCQWRVVASCRSDSIYVSDSGAQRLTLLPPRTHTELTPVPPSTLVPRGCTYDGPARPHERRWAARGWRAGCQGRVASAIAAAHSNWISYTHLKKTTVYKPPPHKKEEKRRRLLALIVCTNRLR
jgi:hypothetical protein